MVRFGSFEFDLACRRLTHDGGEVHLTPKAFDLLAILIEAAPRVVSKTELHERLWRGGVVSDASLTGVVKELRRALEDRNEAAPIIRTAHRVGFAFDAPLIHTFAASRVSRWLVAGERRLPLVDGENVVGRDPQSQVWLDYATVSRRHARIVGNDSGALLEDLGSKNGTTVGERKLLESTVLHNGDRIRFGQVLVVYRESPSGLPTLTHLSRIDAASTEH